MFASPIVRAKTTAPGRSTLPLRTSDSHDAARVRPAQEAAQKSRWPRVASGACWNFSGIPPFSPEVQSERARQSSARALTIQPKLVVGAVDDPLEQEADRAAAQVMRMQTPGIKGAATPQRISRQCAACEEEEAQRLRRKAARAPQAASAAAPGIVHEVLGTPGQPLDAATRAFFEPRFGTRFADVRIHAGAKADESARSIGALAFTSGHHIVFAEGKFQTGTDAGRRLLAHELAHTVQQGGAVIHRQAGNVAPLADPDALAAEISTLLQTPDPVAGMRTGEAIEKLGGLDWAQLVSVLRAVRARNPFDLSVIQGEAPLLISIAAETVALESAARVQPEVLARYRARVKQLSPQQQAEVITTWPGAAAPADPALPAGGLTPPPGAPTGIPGPLLETLYHSYARRQTGAPGSDEYLANAFYAGRPADFWQALTQMGPALDVIRRVYARWSATSVPWSFVDAIYNAWGGTSDGFNFVCDDVSALEAALKSASVFCKDHVGGVYHGLIEGTTPCWREIVSGSPGLHVCTGGARATVHIDPHQVVSGKWPGGFCSYDITGSVVDHFKDLGWL